MHLDYHAILEGTGFHVSLGRTGMKKRVSFEIFVRQIRTTMHKWELWPLLMLKCFSKSSINQYQQHGFESR